MATPGSGSRGTGSVAEINVTPMIDVMLVLLIIFMISLPWITQGFPAMLPSATHAEKDPEQQRKDFVVGLDQAGGLHWQGRAVTEAELRNQLAMAYSGQSDHVLYLKTDANLPYGLIQQVMELARTAGVRVMATVTVNRQPKLFD
jgi:biopolymer transport protein ExbD